MRRACIVYNWEKGRAKPTARYSAQIREFWEHTAESASAGNPLVSQAGMRATHQKTIVIIVSETLLYGTVNDQL